MPLHHDVVQGGMLRVQADQVVDDAVVQRVGRGQIQVVLFVGGVVVRRGGMVQVQADQELVLYR